MNNNIVLSTLLLLLLTPVHPILASPDTHAETEESCSDSNTMASSPSIPKITIGDNLSVSRITAGCWQLAGGHGDIDPAKFAEDMAAHVEAGITTFDTADIYG